MYNYTWEYIVESPAKNIKIKRIYTGERWAPNEKYFYTIVRFLTLRVNVEAVIEVQIFVSLKKYSKK